MRTQGRGLPWTDEIALEFLGLYIDWAEYPFYHNLKGNTNLKDKCRQVEFLKFSVAIAYFIDNNSAGLQ